MQAPDLAVEEMERCVRELGFPGVQIGSHINMWDLNDPELFPVYTVSTACRFCSANTQQHSRGPADTKLVEDPPARGKGQDTGGQRL